jgi:hypothetical protein
MSFGCTQNATRSWITQGLVLERAIWFSSVDLAKTKQEQKTATPLHR